MPARNGFALFPVLLAIALTTIACAGSGAQPTAPTGQGQPAQSEMLKIGYTASLTGSLTNESKEQTQGLKLWADQVNARSGIDVGSRKLQIELVSYDDESKQDRVQELYTRLITDDKADFLISPYGSATAAASAVVTEQYEKTNLIVGAAANSTFIRGYKHAFQVYTPGSKYLIGAIDMLLQTDPNAKRVALVYEKDPFSTEVASAARDYATQKGLDLVVDEGYDTGTSDFAPFVTKIAGLNPDAIVGGGHFAEGTTLARQLFEKQLRAKLVALLVAPADPQFADLGDAADGILAPSQWEPQASYSEAAASALHIPYYGPTVNDYATAYKEKYSYDPGYHSAGGYATGVILEKALRDAGSSDPKAVEAALAKMDVMTFFGHIKFDTGQTYGLQLGHEMVYLQWQKNGQLGRQVVWPSDAASAKLVYPKP